MTLHPSPPPAPAKLEESVPHAPNLRDLARFLNWSVRTVTRRLATGDLPIRERSPRQRPRTFYGSDLRAYLNGVEPGRRQYLARARRPLRDRLHANNLNPSPAAPRVHSLHAETPCS